ncbi:STAS/SEC14 domain-containing protein [Thioclava sp. BHET1]|nr:STAS/SEC14 domain-containing protein [Thioclava sp. BHET1]
MIVLDADYVAYSGDAVWSDTKFGVSHFRAFRRVAMVTDIAWITKAAHLLSPLMPFPFVALPLADLARAMDWIKR